MNALENKIPPPLLFVFTALMMWLVAHFTHSWHLGFLLKLILVLFFVVIAALLAPAAVFSFRKNKTTVDPVHIERASRLVTSGPFNYSRNPMYLALLSLLFAWLCYLAAPWAVIGPILFELYILRFQIFPEEKAMHAKFGADYVAYSKKVRRWI